jgi:membrane associated rhomboid family serine protease
VSCQRCERPICPSCMRPASVGFQCSDCAGAATSRVVTSRELFRGHAEVVVGKVIIGLNVVAFVVMVAASGDPYSPTGSVARAGVLFGPLVAMGEWWRIFTGAFLHAGLFHLGMNMLLLWFLSQELEPALGRTRFVVLYVTSLLGGSLGVLVVSPLSPTVGASGAVFGLMGALVVLQLRARQNPWQSGIGGLVLLNLIFTFLVPGISIGGHLGGLLAGAAAGALLQPLRWPQENAVPRTVAVAGLGAVLGLSAVLLAPELTRAAFY